MCLHVCVCERVCTHAHAKMFNAICPDKIQMKLIALFWPGSSFYSLQNIGPLLVVSESSWVSPLYEEASKTTILVQ